MPVSETYNEDCMIGMKRFPSKFFELAIVDPPYGINGHIEIGIGDKRTGVRVSGSNWKGGEWDKERPTPEYFKELFRVSKNQIIWGGNFFSDLLPPARCWIVWDKIQRVNMADAELAFTSFDDCVRVFQYARGKLQGFLNPYRFHPTEKPVDLYKWLLSNYAKSRDKILDSHMGSQSSRIAAYDMGFDYYGWEIDVDYFNAGEARFKTYLSQPKLELKERKISTQNEIFE